MVPALIILLIAFSFLLIKSADLVIVALRRISRQTKTGVFALSAILLAIGTSLPELFVAITSSLEGTPSLSLGNVLGANIANTSLVAGLAALVFGRVTVHGDFIKKDILVALLAGFLPLFLILDRSLSRVDGLILLATYGAYVTSIFRGRYMEIAEEHKKESFFYRFIRQFNNVNTARNRELGRLFVGIALLLFSSDIIVRIAKELAVAAHIPIFLVGLVILSIGTTLPELVFSLRSIENHEPGMFFGNILGSVIANSTLVIGIAATISPIKIVALDEYFIAALTFVVVFLSYWLFIRTKHRLDRWEAALLVGFYVFFVVMAFV